MIELGNFALVLAWITSLWSLGAGLYAAIQNDQRLSDSSIRAVHCCAVLSLLSLFALSYAFVTHDYRSLYVWQHSNNAMHPVYLVSAVWGGMDGSMLLWAAIMSVFSSLALFRASDHRVLCRWAAPVFGFATGFFLSVVTLLTNPFRLVPGTPALQDGNGLNPLLQNPSMMIHPPTLYLGFTGFVVPFAFCIAALASGQLGTSWIRITRRWTLVAWSFLTAGIILGGNWAYIELGWGGFWAWDPVENASFLPWLTATAFLHSVMVQEQRGMLKVWNIVLSVSTYGLTVFGTFLTRSGIVQSVHAFAATDVGWVFLAYLGVLLLLTAVLIAWRWSELRPENQLQSYLSREAAFLFNNLLLLGICFATLWGVMFPVLSEAVTGQKSVVGPPFFNQVNTPMFLGLLFLMGVGPVIAWRRASASQIIRLFARPFLAGSILTVVFIIVDPTRLYSAIAFGLSLFVVATIEAEIRRGIKAQRALSQSPGSGLLRLVKRKPRRYGGFLVHLGVAVVAVAITAASAYKTERDITLRVGETVQIGRYMLELQNLEELIERGYDGLRANVAVRSASNGALLTTLSPERRLYRKPEEVTTEVALRSTLREDLYLAFAGIESPQEVERTAKLDQLPAVFKVYINPLQVWLWFGGIVMMLGSLLVLLPSRERASERVFSAEHAAQKI